MIGEFEYSETSIIWTPIIRTFDYPNAKLTALLEYFVN